jgi:YggT family protein
VLGSMRVIATLIDLYSVVVLAAVIMSWVHADRRHPLVQFVFNATEPVLAPIRRLLPPAAGVDFSPMILLVLLRVLRGLW